MKSQKEKGESGFAVFALKNIVLAIIILFALGWLTLLLVDVYTRHNDTVIVPNVQGMYVEEAQSAMSKYKLGIQIVDSVYISGRALGSVVEQTPPAGSTVKPYRDIYLVINAKQVRQIPLPDIIEGSFRQADATLKSVGLSVGNVERQPSEYKDLVLAVKYKGVAINAGQRIPLGEAVTLVVGEGLGSADVAIPAIKGLPLDSARDVLLDAGFVIGSVNYDKPPEGNDAEYVIYRQKPIAGSTAEQGSRIDVWLSTDKSLLNKVFNEDENEEFF